MSYKLCCMRILCRKTAQCVEVEQETMQKYKRNDWRPKFIKLSVMRIAIAKRLCTPDIQRKLRAKQVRHKIPRQGTVVVTATTPVLRFRSHDHLTCLSFQCVICPSNNSLLGHINKILPSCCSMTSCFTPTVNRLVKFAVSWKILRSCGFASSVTELAGNTPELKLCLLLRSNWC